MIVALDPGHGGADPGAQSAGLVEAGLNLQLAFVTASALRGRGFGVYLTRTGDETVGLAERVERAAGARADLFLSLHHNAAAFPEARGTEVLYDPGFASSRELAAAIRRELTLLPTQDRGLVARPDLPVLTLASRAGMPACLVELAFLTNPADRQLLLAPAFHRLAAAALARGVRRYAGPSRAAVGALALIGSLSYAGLLVALGKKSGGGPAPGDRP